MELALFQKNGSCDRRSGTASLLKQELMQTAFSGFECVPAAKRYMCTHKPIFSGPQTPWKRVIHWRGEGNGSFAAQQLRKPCLFRFGRLVWFQSQSAMLSRHSGDKWVAMVDGHPVRQTPEWRLAAWAQLTPNNLVSFISILLTQSRIQSCAIHILTSPPPPILASTMFLQDYYLSQMIIFCTSYLSFLGHSQCRGKSTGETKE